MSDIFIKKTKAALKYSAAFVFFLLVSNVPAKN